MASGLSFILDFNAPDFDLLQAEKVSRELAVRAQQARLATTPTIQLHDGRVHHGNLKQMFEQVYPDKPDRSEYWANKFIYRLQCEWLDGHMDLEVWCYYCEKFPQAGEKCVHIAPPFKTHFTWHAAYSITAASIVRSEQGYKLRRGERDKMLMHYDCMIRSLRQAVEQAN